MNHSKYIKIKQSGFTLLELLMVIAVVGILTTLAVPRLQSYSQKAKFTEVINAVAPYKAAVEQCLMEYDETECDASKNGIPSGFTVAQGRVESVTVADGIITATGVAKDFPKRSDANVTYILDPKVGDNSVTWSTDSKSSCLEAPALCQ